MSSSANDRRNVMAAIWNTIGDSYGSGVPFLVETAEILVEQADLRSGDRVIDLGTGNGHGLIPAAKAVNPGVVVGVDISDVMLDAARRRATALGLANIDLRYMDVTSLEFPDASFDVALASTVFQFVSYSPAALAEWHRVLVPGGRLLLSVPVPGSLVPLDGLMRDFFPRQPIEIQNAWRATGQPPGSAVLPDLAELCEQVGFVPTRCGHRTALHVPVGRRMVGVPMDARLPCISHDAPAGRSRRYGGRSDTTARTDIAAKRRGADARHDARVQGNEVSRLTISSGRRRTDGGISIDGHCTVNDRRGEVLGRARRVNDGSEETDAGAARREHQRLAATEQHVAERCERSALPD